MGEPVDWEFFVDFSQPSGQMKALSPEDVQQLELVAIASKAVQNTHCLDASAWDDLASALRKGRELEIPDHELEEHSGLRGQFMLDFIAGSLDIQDLISKALPNR